MKNYAYIIKLTSQILGGKQKGTAREFAFLLCGPCMAVSVYSERTVIEIITFCNLHV